MKIGDLVKIKQLDPNIQFSSSTYIIRLIQKDNIYISSKFDPEKYSLLYYDDISETSAMFSKSWKIRHSPYSYSVKFIPTKNMEILPGGFTNISDIDKKILGRLNNQDLKNTCQSSKYLNSLCQDDDFWRVRTMEQIPDTYPYKEANKSWKQHFIFFDELEISSYSLTNSSIDGKVGVVKYLIDHGVDPTSAIIWASSYGRIEVVKYLMSLVDDQGNTLVDPTNSDNKAIRWASGSNHLEVVKYLASLTDNKGNALVDQEGRNSAIYAASKNGHLEIIKYLASIEGNDLDDLIGSYNSSIIMGSYGGYFDMVKYIISLTDINGNMLADPAAQDNSAIILASTKGHLNIVKYLISLVDDEGNILVDPTAKYNRAIIDASTYGHLEVVKYLMSLKDNQGNTLVDITAQNNSAITMASKNDKPEMVKELLKYDEVVDFLKISKDRTSKFIVRKYKL